MPQSPWMQALKSVRYAPQMGNWREIAAAAWRGEQARRVQLRNGVVIEGATTSRIMGLYKEIWYRDSYRLRSHPLPPAATVIDIGANIGMFAVYAAVVGKAAHVFCYEPFPDSFTFLRRNGETNKLQAAHAFQLAIAGKRERRTMQVGTCHGWNTLFGPAELPSIEVDCLTLADVFEQQALERCDFLKLDCEGSEYEILLDAPAAVLARINRVALEYHDHLTPHRHGELTQLLQDAGLTVEEVAHEGAPTGYIFAARAA
jgi:FkbM family methyltransferase